MTDFDMLLLTIWLLGVTATIIYLFHNAATTGKPLNQGELVVVVAIVFLTVALVLYSVLQSVMA